MVRADFVDADDWMGIYIDGVLVYQGHSIRSFDCAELMIKYSVDDLYNHQVNWDWMEGRNDLPDLLTDCKLD